MWEDQYQVYRRYGDGEYDLRASDMTIEDAVLFVKSVFQESLAIATIMLGGAVFVVYLLYHVFGG